MHDVCLIIIVENESEPKSSNLECMKSGLGPIEGPYFIGVYRSHSPFMPLFSWCTTTL